MRAILTFQNLEFKELFFSYFKNFILTSGIRKIVFTILITFSPKGMACTYLLFPPDGRHERYVCVFA